MHVQAYLIDLDRQRQNKWIRALHEPLANIEAEKSCITCSDVHKNGEHKLILVDFKEDACRLVLFQVWICVVHSLRYCRVLLQWPNLRWLTIRPELKPYIVIR